MRVERVRLLVLVKRKASATARLNSQAQESDREGLENELRKPGPAWVPVWIARQREGLSTAEGRLRGRGPHLRELLDLLPRVVRLDPLHERNILMPEPRSADVHAVVRGDEGVRSLQLVSRLVK